jgi:hypothetical protein
MSGNLSETGVKMNFEDLYRIYNIDSMYYTIIFMIRQQKTSILTNSLIIMIKF